MFIEPRSTLFPQNWSGAAVQEMAFGRLRLRAVRWGKNDCLPDRGTLREGREKSNGTNLDSALESIHVMTLVGITL